MPDTLPHTIAGDFANGWGVKIRPEWSHKHHHEPLMDIVRELTIVQVSCNRKMHKRIETCRWWSASIFF